MCYVFKLIYSVILNVVNTCLDVIELPFEKKLQLPIIQNYVVVPAGIPWRGPERPLPGRAGSFAEASTRGETSGADFRSWYPQPLRHARGNAGLTRSGANSTLVTRRFVSLFRYLSLFPFV